MRRSVRLRACTVLLLLGIGHSLSTLAPVSAQTATEYQVKAAYVYAFTKFVEWPPSSFAHRDTPLQMCVFADPVFESELSRLARGKSVGGHPVSVMGVSKAEAVRECHLLFLSSSEGSKLHRILETLRGTSVLTIGETKGFVEEGGIINLVRQAEHIRFEVNHKAANDAGIQVSARLLSVATLVLE
jgi:hypothetical protein